MDLVQYSPQPPLPFPPNYNYAQDSCTGRLDAGFAISTLLLPSRQRLTEGIVSKLQEGVPMHVRAIGAAERFAENMSFDGSNDQSQTLYGLGT